MNNTKETTTNYSKLSLHEKIQKTKNEIHKQQQKLKSITDKRKLEIGSLAEKFGLLNLNNQTFIDTFKKLSEHDS